MNFVFWLSLVSATYSYISYPILLLLLPHRKVHKTEIVSPVRRLAVVIAARNEGANISAKLDNTLALNRGSLALDVIVASDASDDKTDQIVLGYADRGIRLVRSPNRLGKEYAQGLAIASTDADLFVFTDVGTTLPDDALDHLLEAFKDPSIGAVSSVDKFITPDGNVQGEGMYVRYEMWLRDLEAQFHSLVGLSGSFFAARREVCENWDPRVQSDFGTALSCVQHGLRATSDRNLIGLYRSISDSRKEYARKVRTVTRGINSLRLRSEVLDITRYGRFSFEVFSHKVMRWATPWFLLSALGASIALAFHHRLYQLLLVCQLGLYLTPIASLFAPPLRKFGVARLAIYFVEVNAAILHATILALSGRTMLTWEPSKR